MYSLFMVVRFAECFVADFGLEKFNIGINVRDFPIDKEGYVAYNDNNEYGFIHICINRFTKKNLLRDAAILAVSALILVRKNLDLGFLCAEGLYITDEVLNKAKKYLESYIISREMAPIYTVSAGEQSKNFYGMPHYEYNPETNKRDIPCGHFIEETGRVYIAKKV